MKIIIEDVIEPNSVTTEDNGCARIWYSNSFPPVDPDEPDDAPDLGPGVFFRFQSWDAKDKKHEIFNQFVGKPVRVTIESLDVLDQLSEIEP